MSTEARLHDLSIWLLAEEPPAERNPAALYLAGRPPRSREGARRALDALAGLVTAGHGTVDRLAWHLIREDQVAVIRTALTDRHPASEAKRILATLRGVLMECRRLDLIPEGAFKRAHAAARAGTQVSRGELRSVFESCAEDHPHSQRSGAVRTLLYGNGVKEEQTAARGQTAPHGEAAAQGRAMRRADDPAAPPPSRADRAASMLRLHLRRVPRREGIAHALWEAGLCVRSSAFCAGLAMLWKALDLWSLEYLARHGEHGAAWAEPSSDLDARLTRIAEENTIYRETILMMRDVFNAGGPSLGAGLNQAPGSPEAAGLGLHEGIVCRGGYATSHDGYAISRIKETYRNLHEQVTILIAATTPELPL